jgi:hypothetical protein
LARRADPIPLDTRITGKRIPAAETLFNATLAAHEPGRPQGFLSRLLGRKTVTPALPPFAHLVMHSDAGGFYVPIGFDKSLFPAVMPDDTEPLWPLGPVQQLAEDLEQLARALKLPPDPPEPHDVLKQYLDDRNLSSDPQRWQAQPVATYTLPILRQTFAQSQKTGAAISFG